MQDEKSLINFLVIILFFGLIFIIIIICEILRYVILRSLQRYYFISSQVPVPIRSLSIFGRKCSISRYIFSSKGETVFNSRKFLADCHPVGYYLSYDWNIWLYLFHHTAKDMNEKWDLRMMIVDFKLIPDILEKPDVWDKCGNAPPVNHIIGLSCTRANGQVAVRQRRILAAALRNRGHFADFIERAAFTLTSAVQDIIMSTCSTTKESYIDSEKVVTLDLCPILQQVSLELMMRLIFGDINVEVDAFSKKYLSYWDILRQNPSEWPSSKKRQRLEKLTDDINILKSMLTTIIHSRARHLSENKIVSLADTVGLKDCSILDKLIVQTTLKQEHIFLFADDQRKQSINVTETQSLELRPSDEPPSSTFSLSSSSTAAVAAESTTSIPQLSGGGDRLSEEELVHNLYSLVTAGYETTGEFPQHGSDSFFHSLCMPYCRSAHTLAVCVLELSRNYRVQDFLANPAEPLTQGCAELSQARTGKDNNYLPKDANDVLEPKKILRTFVKECLRLYPPVPQLIRRNRVEAKVGEVTCRPGTRVTIDVIGMQRAERHWGRDADRFRLGRWGVTGFDEPDSTSTIRSCVDRLREQFAFVIGAIYSLNSRNRGRREGALDEDVEKNGELFSSNPNPTPKDKVNKNWMPFGIGPKSCIGQSLALMSVEGVLVPFIAKYKISVNPDFKPYFTQSATLRLNGLIVNISNRSV